MSLKQSKFFSANGRNGLILLDKQQMQTATTGSRSRGLAKFRLRKVVNNTWSGDSPEATGARTRSAPFMTPRTPGAVHVNAALMRLPAWKVKKREKICVT